MKLATLQVLSDAEVCAIHAATLEVSLPKGYASRLSAKSVSADINVADHMYAGLDLSTTSGEIRVGAVSASDFAMHSTPDGLRAIAVTSQRVDMSSASGDVDVKSLAGDTSVHTNFRRGESRVRRHSLPAGGGQHVRRCDAAPFPGCPVQPGCPFHLGGHLLQVPYHGGGTQHGRGPPHAGGNRGQRPEYGCRPHRFGRYQNREVGPFADRLVDKLAVLFDTLIRELLRNLPPAGSAFGPLAGLFFIRGSRCRPSQRQNALSPSSTDRTSSTQRRKPSVTLTQITIRNCLQKEFAPHEAGVLPASISTQGFLPPPTSHPGTSSGRRKWR